MGEFWFLLLIVFLLFNGLQIQDALALVKHMSNTDQCTAENLWKEALEQLQQLIKEASENVSKISIHNNRMRLSYLIGIYSYLPLQYK